MARSRGARRFVDVLGWDSYVVAAVVVQGVTVGLLHGDAFVSGRTLDSLDVEVASLYAEGLAGVFERAVLREMLQLHHHELRSAVGVDEHPARPARDRRRRVDRAAAPA